MRPNASNGSARNVSNARLQLGKLPDDVICMVVFIDQYNFARWDAYRGEGPALVLQPQRQQLEQFLADLKQQYMEFKLKFNKMDEWNRESYGDDWEPMELD